jgi:hypothetical protein
MLENGNNLVLGKEGKIEDIERGLPFTTSYPGFLGNSSEI